MLQIPLEWFEFSFKCLLTLGLTYVYKATISVTSPHITSTHYKRSDFQEWILGSKVCRHSCQQCCYILHSHRCLYPSDIHWYLEETYLLCKTLLDVQPHSHIAYGIMWLHHHSLCEIQVNLIVCHSIKILNALYMFHVTLTCAAESISLIATVTSAVVTSNGISASGIFITVIEPVWCTFINI